MANKRGGRGAVASTTESIYLDTLLKETSEEVSNNNKHFFFSNQIRFDEDERLGSINYILPDGGAFYVGNELVAVFEAKKQGKIGNAIERWYKNNVWCREFVNKDVSYVTFCSGYVKEDGNLYRILYPFHNRGRGSINKFTKGKNSIFFKEHWTREEVIDIMQEVLDKIVEKI